MKEVLRIHKIAVVEYPVSDLMCFLVGTKVLNNPNIVRIDDIKTSDIVFYEKEKKNEINS